MKLLISCVFTFLISIQGSLISQEYHWFYLVARDTVVNPEFKAVNGYFVYTGHDEKLKNVLTNYHISIFKKTLKKARKENLKKTFFVIANKDGLMEDLLKETSHLFVDGELINKEDKKIFEPNDYGLTSTIGNNKGLKANLSYLDYLGLPKAWYYTTGLPEMKIGISDATVDTTNLDFKGKTKVIKKSSFSNGHGSSVASIATAQGDNGYGVPGICYDCDIYATNYGDFKSFRQLIELSNLGVKVINCSWVSSQYYETAQTAVDKIFENGTILVAAAGNKGWDKTKGNKMYYPASYNHVISVSVGMYKYETVNDNILISEKGNPYAENIRGYLGRTVGFKDNNIKNEHYIYPVSTTTLNSEVDILTPSNGVLLFRKYLLENKIIYDIYEHTSNATPFVTGTIGLMISLYPCLPVDEVEGIIKMTATNIDAIEVNKPYAGMYGAGILHTGRAVEMVYQLYTSTETSYIQNQRFSRWDFKLTALSKKVVMRNQKFTDSTTLKLTAKNQIVLGENTILKPDNNGSISLKINPSLQKECELQLREGFPDTPYYTAPRK